MKLVLVTTLAVAGLALAGCGSSGSSSSGGSSPSTSTTSSAAAASGSNAVAIKDYSYTPGNLTVKVGTAVTWTMEDSGTTHTVTDKADGIDSGDLKTSGGKSTFTYTFSKAGTYSYICTYHQYMKGTITVQ